MLNELQIKAAIEYAKGAKITEIAKKMGVTRQTVYNWLDNKEFTNEVDRYTQQIKTSAERNLSNKVDAYIDALEDIAFNGRSEKTRTEALTYLLDRVLGKSTTKIQDVTEVKEQDQEAVSWEDIKDKDILELKDKDII